MSYNSRPMSIYQQAKLLWALSPMDGVTDSPMRQITKKYGRPDLMWTEFVNVAGLHHAPARLLPDFEYEASEKPLLAQIYGTEPEYFYQETKEICARGFYGVDLNFGCPAKTVVASGAGANLIQTPELAAKIYHATRQATVDYSQETGSAPLPVSIKTRLGVAQPQIDEWFPFLLKLQPDLITVHGRTLKQGYAGSADWAAIKQVVAWRARLSPMTAIFGNGDVTTRAQGIKLAAESGVDGVVVARGALGNPWVFTDRQPSVVERAQVALEHCQLYYPWAIKRGKLPIAPLRKHLAAYIKDFPNAKSLRVALMTAPDLETIESLLQLEK